MGLVFLKEEFTVYFVSARFVPLRANLYLYKNENVCVCTLFFLGHFETDWDTIWHTVSF